MLSILDLVRKKEALDPVEKQTWKLFQSFASELIFPNIHIRSFNEADKAACDVAASIASECRLSTRTAAI
jgi:hypothetical protein